MLPAEPHPAPEDRHRTVTGRRYFGGFALPPEPRLTRRYMCGECGHMALALHAHLPGGRCWRGGVGHFAVEDAHGDFWDVRGQMNLGQLWDGLAGTQMTPTTREGIVADLNTGVFEDGIYALREERRARDLVRSWLPLPQLTSRRAPSKPRC